MAYDLEEQESIDQLKAWWEKWGTPVTAAVCVVCVGFAGWNGWKWWQARQSAAASGAYVQLQNAALQLDMKNVSSISNGLIKEYGTTVYATLGALTAAGVEADTGDTKSAEAMLRWVIDKSGREEYETLARLRLAGVYLADKKVSEAEAVMKDVKPVKEQEALVEDRLGDIAFAKNDTAKAAEHWDKALKASAQGSAIQQVVSLKRGALPPKD